MCVSHEYISWQVYFTTSVFHDECISRQVYFTTSVIHDMCISRRVYSTTSVFHDTVQQPPLCPSSFFFFSSSFSISNPFFAIASNTLSITILMIISIRSIITRSLCRPNHYFFFSKFGPKKVGIWFQNLPFFPTVLHSHDHQHHLLGGNVILGWGLKERHIDKRQQTMTNDDEK